MFKLLAKILVLLRLDTWIVRIDYKMAPEAACEKAFNAGLLKVKQECPDQNFPEIIADQYAREIFEELNLEYYSPLEV